MLNPAETRELFAGHKREAHEEVTRDRHANTSASLTALVKSCTCVNRRSVIAARISIIDCTQGEHAGDA